MAVVGLGVELRILNIVVNKPYDVLDCGKIVAHIGNFDIRNRAARGNLLELAFETEFGERVYILAYVDVIAVCIIALVGYVLYSAEPFFIYSCKAIAQAFRGGAVKPEAEARFLLPFFAMVAQGLHYFKRKLRALGVGMGNALDKLCYLVKPDIAERYCGIAVV